VSVAAFSCPDNLQDRSTNALAFGEAGFPIIPVALRFDEARSKWRKEPMAPWSLATTDEATIAGWWQRWPEALPGIPLRMVDWAVVDADTVEGVAAVTGLGPLGPHSAVTTRSGGRHLVFAQPDPPVTKHDWCEGVEVLGSSCLLTCYDLEELKFPRVAPRAVLPKMFWKAKEVGSKPIGYLINKERAAGCERAAHDVALVASLTDALWQLDPLEWRGRHDEWLSLANGCKFAGIDEDEFIAWSIQDEMYRGDERLIRRKWKSLTPTHGGALFAALKGTGIKVAKGHDNERIGALFIDEVPNLHPTKSKPYRVTPTRNLNNRTTSLCDWLNREPTEPNLFKVGCAFAEIVSEGRLKPSQAVKLLQGNCWRLRKAMGEEQFQATIARAFRHVEEKLLEGEVS
jgi:hypothetical protein